MLRLVLLALIAIAVAMLVLRFAPRLRAPRIFWHCPPARHAGAQASRRAVAG